MNKEQFDQKFRSKDGIKKLYTMMENLDTLDSIAGYFGVSKERVRQWSVELFGKKYDPRDKRREKRELGL